jgi:hypothetical protein
VLLLLPLLLGLHSLLLLLLLVLTWPLNLI